MSTEVFARYARFYELFYRGKDYASEARFVHELLGGHGEGAATLLDIGCGTGAHARELAKLGWQVAGVDLSPTMLEIARSRTPAEAGIEFFTGAAADFALQRTFTAVVSLFHVVSYQTGSDEALRMFKNVRRHLVPGGRFVFDFWHGPGVLADPPAVRVQRLETDEFRLTRIAEPTHHVEKSIIEVSYELLVEAIATNRLERVREVHRMRYFSLDEIRELLRAAGFSVVQAHAGLTREPLNQRAWYGSVVAAAG